MFLSTGTRLYLSLKRAPSYSTTLTLVGYLTLQHYHYARAWGFPTELEAVTPPHGSWSSSTVKRFVFSRCVVAFSFICLAEKRRFSSSSKHILTPNNKYTYSTYNQNMYRGSAHSRMTTNLMTLTLWRSSGQTRFLPTRYATQFLRLSLFPFLFEAGCYVFASLYTCPASVLTPLLPFTV